MKLADGRPQALLEAAVVIEDGMGYMEPPRLYQPVRHCLGRLLLSDDRPAEAAQVCAPASHAVQLCRGIRAAIHGTA